MAPAPRRLAQGRQDVWRRGRAAAAAGSAARAFGLPHPIACGREGALLPRLESLLLAQRRLHAGGRPPSSRGRRATATRARAERLHGGTCAANNAVSAGSLGARACPRPPHGSDNRSWSGRPAWPCRWPGLIALDSTPLYDLPRPRAAYCRCRRRPCDRRRARRGRRTRARERGSPPPRTAMARRRCKKARRRRAAGWRAGKSRR